MARSRLEVLIRSEVARLKALTPPYDASAEETEAFGARRKDYADRVIQALEIVSGDHPDVLKAVGKVLGRLSSQPPSIGIPNPDAVLRDVRAELDRVKPKPDGPSIPCAECTRQGGVRHALNGSPHGVLQADVTPAMDPRLREPLCALHASEVAYDQHVDRWRRNHPGREDCPYSAPATTRVFHPKPETTAAVARWLKRFDEAGGRGESNPMPPPSGPDVDRNRAVAQALASGTP